MCLQLRFQLGISANLDTVTVTLTWSENGA
jgi:hypothetical protein